MMEQKNKYAYDNGHLQATVTQLQSQIQASSISQTEVLNLKQLNTSLQEKYNKVHKQLFSISKIINLELV